MSPDLPWTLRQRRALAALLAIFILILFYRYYCNPHYIPDPLPPGDLSSQLIHQIDPNIADESALASLPRIGPSLARAIIAYRDSSPSRPAFKTLADLRQVKGIGPLTLPKLAPYLTFPPPTTNPSPP